jgi:8-oxo-dGTP pyrophosphatase MutT (NUDIX family)
VADKILRHLDPSTGDVSKGEFQCTSIGHLDYNPFYVQVIYETARPDGKKGSQFMRFYYFTAAMRCLPVTEDGHVVMIQEHRRTRGEWVQMLPAGGAKAGKALEVLVGEIYAEAGARATDASRVMEIACKYMDDGVFSERLHLLTIDRLTVPLQHINPEEGIKGIVLVPWKEWKGRALDGEYDDVFCDLFASRCELDTSNRILVRGAHSVLVAGRCEEIPMDVPGRPI